MKSRFSDEVVQRLRMPGLRADRIECRGSACEVELSFGAADLEVARETSQFADPPSVVSWVDGGLGSLEHRRDIKDSARPVADLWNTEIRDDGRYATTYIVIFGEDSIDPERYDEFRAMTRQTRNERVEQDQAGGMTNLPRLPNDSEQPHAPR